MILPLLRSFNSMHLQDAQEEPYSGAFGFGKRISAGLAGASMIGTGFRKGRLEGVLLTAVGADMLYHSITKGGHLYDFLLPESAKGMRDAPAYADGEMAQATVVVDQPAKQLYALWRNFENLPYFMQHVESVQMTGDTRSHWRVAGPLGMTLDWDARVIKDRKNELIGWQTLEGKEVAHAGSVRFEALQARPPRTRVTVKLQYRPVAGRVGSAIASLLGADPQQRIEDDLMQFKGFAESMDLDELIRRLDSSRGPISAYA